MNFSSAIKNSCIELDFKADKKDEVLKEIARLAKNDPILKNVKEKTIYKALADREDVGSTGFGNGIAIPHCTIENISDFVVGVLVIPDGVDYDSIDGKETKILSYIIAPKEKKNEHIRILSNISKILQQSENIKKILESSSSEQIINIFSKVLDKGKDKQKEKKYTKFTIIIQDENSFYDILEIFTEINDCFLSIINAENASKYLYSMPLFSHFWNEEKKGFNRIILAIVNNTFANDTLRKLNLIIDSLDKNTGVLVLSQEISYINGSINL
ncbi:MAG: PTS sugar transporter subunit IIA [Candidatus Marinimicrobia bacterium]|nr:PTS sugar transporter subunit IIA [Candidatus Neomarinimicrobiota bacterium]